MLTVITAATNRQLTTPDRVKAILGVDASDARLAFLIDTATSSIEGFCNRVFAQQTVRQTMCGSGARAILSQAPVTTITAVTLDGQPLGQDDYSLEGDALYRMRRGVRALWQGRALVVDYVGGYTLPSDEQGAAWTLPASVERAAMLLVAAAVSSTGRDPLLKSENVQGVGSFSYAAPGSTSTGGLGHGEAEALLARFEMPVVA
ncbi:phage gp6-like head-tail connector protein [Methylobacterium platani]|uniref:Phage gp6-like head-tail connector protein n=2 Tax=Methylobacterium platani TaxID=427683 RepID=A0A179SH08_9HYPH|nr:phage gp6-like head-tail connector protein [Methylobacterium platani]KMO20379.1 hypothetical protein SQ03_05680 [Methylobacterium platani JCM 14648]OAS26290.1 hypothetical protein A5481_06115 [Methylobacterium platani]